MPLIPQQNPPYYTTDETNTATKIYRALLTQTGTNAPVATVLQNTFNQTPIWTYGGVGDYICSIPGELTLNKTQVFLQSNILGYQAIPPNDSFNANQFEIYTYYIGDETLYNDSLIKTPITIISYP